LGAGTPAEEFAATAADGALGDGAAAGVDVQAARQPVTMQTERARFAC